jgi:hypothetical protein
VLTLREKYDCRIAELPDVWLMGNNLRMYSLHYCVRLVWTKISQPIENDSWAIKHAPASVNLDGTGSSWQREEGIELLRRVDAAECIFLRRSKLYWLWKFLAKIYYESSSSALYFFSWHHFQIGYRGISFFFFLHRCKSLVL